MILIVRLLLFSFFVFLIYRLVRYFLSPKRKLELAYEQKAFFLLDDTDNVRKNFHITYKGALFEGEKYLGTTNTSFEVISIFIWTKTPERLKGLTKNDFLFLEEKVLEKYPHAKIDWKSPIKELVADNEA
nr:sigma-w pathway protein ysdB [Bacillus kexueae]